MSLLGIDTSVAIPLLLTSHRRHSDVVRWWDGREAALSGHALAETYSVLTRLPGDSRLAPGDAARLLRERFSRPLLISPDTAAQVADTLSQLDIAGGAVHDALVALAARDNGVQLATRDARATATYDAVGIDVVVVG